MVVYNEWAHCYGCGYRIKTSDLGGVLGRGGFGLLSSSSVRPPADIKSELERIKALPLAPVRGLSLPVDGDSYYIVWPCSTYYKRRKFLPGSGPKYINPRGHAKPLFIPRQTKGCKSLAVVEGELNALSLAAIQPPFDVCSPGSCVDFSEKLLEQNSKFFSGYTRFRLILDKDLPGLNAVIKFKGLLLQHTPYVEVILMKRDCNEMLIDGSLKEECKRWGG